MCCNGHPYQICLSPSMSVNIRLFSTKFSVLRIYTSGSPMRCGTDKTDDTTPHKGGSDFVSGEGSNTGKGGGKGKDGGNNTHLSCPKCGDPCTRVETFVCKYFTPVSYHRQFFFCLETIVKIRV